MLGWFLAELFTVFFFFIKTDSTVESINYYSKYSRNNEGITKISLSFAFTRFGVSCVRESPWPKRPYSPNPQVNSSPDEVTAALWLLPAAMSRILNPSTDNIVTLMHRSLIFKNESKPFKASRQWGTSRVAWWPWPSLPSSPSPQEKTLPSAVRANACLPPEWTATLRMTWCDSAVTWRGELVLFEWPRPSRPLLPSPQA